MSEMRKIAQHPLETGSMSWKTNYQLLGLLTPK